MISGSVSLLTQKKGERKMEVDRNLKHVLAVRNISLQQLSEDSDIPLETLRNIYYGKIANP